MADEAQQAVAELAQAVATLAESNNQLIAENQQLRAALERVIETQPPALRSRTAAPRGRG